MRRALLLALVTSGCARWTDRHVRRDWQRADENSDKASVGVDDRAEERPARGTRVPPTELWSRFDAMVERAVRILSRSPDDDRLAQVARRWCEITPEPQLTEHGPVLVCTPQDQFYMQGYAVTLEIGSSGVIGWVIHEAAEEKSLALLTELRERTASHCLSPFREPPQRSAPQELVLRRDEFEICPVEGGSTLAIGRIPNPGLTTWQISIAVVGAN